MKTQEVVVTLIVSITLIIGLVWFIDSSVFNAIIIIVTLILTIAGATSLRNKDQ